jgi:hypothetical protein
MRRLTLMEIITMTNATQISRVRSSFPQAADRSLIVGDRGVFYAPNHKAPAVTDGAYFRPGRPLT